MGNSKTKLFSWLNKISSRSLRELTYLLCSDDLHHPLIPAEVYYATFLNNQSAQYGLDFYKNLEKEQLKCLELVDPNAALGRYVERSLAAWFKLNPKYDLLAFNLQLIEEGITLGEIDFLLWEKQRQQAIHLEFALKYYLAHELNGELRYTGPKGRDTLEGKAKKLIEQQLPLSSRYKHLLSNKLNKYSFESRLMLKGFIFYPHDYDHKECLWIKQSDIEKYALNKQDECYILEERRDWIYPYDPLIRKNPLKENEFKRAIAKSEVLPLLCLMKARELEILLMVVEDQWPKPIRT